MSIAFHVLMGSGRLEPYTVTIEQVAGAAISKITARLPISGVDVVFQDHPVATIPGLGIGGFAATGHLIQVSLDPRTEDFEESLESHLPRTLAHELHHCARWRGPGYGSSLGEAFVSEGLADHFDLEVNGGKPYQWTQALDEDELMRWWKRAQDNLWSTYSHAQWFFNQSHDGPPYWAGYSLGFWLVQSYLDNEPQAHPSGLHGIAATEVIGGTGLVSS